MNCEINSQIKSTSCKHKHGTYSKTVLHWSLRYSRVKGPVEEVSNEVETTKAVGKGVTTDPTPPHPSALFPFLLKFPIMKRPDTTNKSA